MKIRLKFDMIAYLVCEDRVGKHGGMAELADADNS